MEGAHGLHHTVLNSRRARDVEFGQEVVCHCNQRILWPAGKPVHGTTTNQARKLQGAISEFLSNLRQNLMEDDFEIYCKTPIWKEIEQKFLKVIKIRKIKCSFFDIQPVQESGRRGYVVNKWKAKGMIPYTL